MPPWLCVIPLLVGCGLGFFTHLRSFNRLRVFLFVPPPPDAHLSRAVRIEPLLCLRLQQLYLKSSTRFEFVVHLFFIRLLPNRIIRCKAFVSLTNYPHLFYCLISLLACVTSRPLRRRVARRFPSRSCGFGSAPKQRLAAWRCSSVVCCLRPTSKRFEAKNHNWVIVK